MGMENDEVRRILEDMLSRRENECIEFKLAERDYHFDDLGKYFSAISNEANLKRKQYGWLIFGIEDKKRTIAGTEYRIGEKKLDQLKSEVRNNTSDAMTFMDIYELYIDKKRILMFQIPAAGRLPVSWKGTCWSREGSSLVNLSDLKAERIRKNGSEDWSEKMCAGSDFKDLDKDAVSLFRKKFDENNPDSSISSLDDISFFEKIGLIVEGRVTNAAMVLLVSEDSAMKIDPRPQITWILRDRDGETRDGKIFAGSLLTGMDKALNKIRNLNYKYSVDRSTALKEVLMYEPTVLRELVHNSIAHQDYRLKGRINIVEHDDHLDIINEGAFIPDSVEELLDTSYVPPYYRNRLLAFTMAKIGMIEAYGSGINGVMRKQRGRYFPLPDYNLKNNRVSVRVFGRVLDESYTRLLFERTDLSIGTVYLLDRVQKKETITKEQAAELRSEGLVGGRYPKLYPSVSVSKITERESRHILDQGLEDEYYEKLIIKYLEKYDSASRSDIDGLLINKLPDSLDGEARNNKIRNLIQKLSKTRIENVGGRRHPKWILRK